MPTFHRLKTSSKESPESTNQKTLTTTIESELKSGSQTNSLLIDKLKSQKEKLIEDVENPKKTNAETKVKNEIIIQKTPKINDKSKKRLAAWLKSKQIKTLAVDKIADKGYHYNDFFRYQQSLSLKLNIFGSLIIFVLIVNIFLMIKIQSNPNIGEVNGIDNYLDKNNSLALSETKSISKKLENSTITDNKSIKIIDSFQNNPSLVDLGFKVDIGKNYIANFQDPNCQTPIVPPSVNGCGFAVLLSSMGIPDSGVAYKSLNIEANFKDPNGKIQIDQKNYEKGSFTKTIGILDAQSISNKIVLPVGIPASDTLFFRFWTKSSTVVINKISIDYYLVSDLKKVNLNLGKVDPIFKTGNIYQDTDENQIYNPNIDLKWSCIPNFPGVSALNITPNTSLKLVRDDACFLAKKPTEWQNDNGALALPPGKWLLVLDDKHFYPFTISPDKDEFNIDLKS